MNRKHLFPVIIVLSFALVMLSGFSLSKTNSSVPDSVTTSAKIDNILFGFNNLTVELTAQQSSSRFTLRNIEEFHEGLAWIIFQDQNKEEYIGVIDEAGNLKFYLACSEIDFQYTSGSDLFYSGRFYDYGPYKNGYASIKTEGSVFIIDTSGNIVRSFKRPYSKYNDSSDGCLCCNAGYALLRETHSGFESVETIYTIVNPQGESKQIYAISGKGTLSTDFIYDGVVKLYKSKDSGALLYYPMLDKMVEIGRSSTTLVMTGESEWIAIYDYTGDVLKYIDNNGNKHEETIPEECRRLAFLSEVDDGYILFERGGVPCVVYNIKTHTFRTYNGKYADRVVCTPSSVYYDSIYGRSYMDHGISMFHGARRDDIGGGMLSLVLMGADNNRYIVLLDLETMTELCEPFLGVGCELINGYILVPDEEFLGVVNTNYTTFYDAQGHELYKQFYPLETFRFLIEDKYAIMENKIPVIYNSKGNTYFEVNYESGQQLH